MRVALLVVVGLTTRGAADPVPAPHVGILPAGVADNVLRPGDQPIVRMLDAGAAPRRELAYTLAEGTRDRLSVASVNEGQIAGMPKMRAPELDLTLAITVAGTAGNEWRIVAAIDDATLIARDALAAPVAKPLRDSAAGMKGARANFIVNRRGATHDQRFDPPPGTPAAMKQMYAESAIDTFVVVLPPGPVGVGAHWVVVSRLNRGGLDLVQRNLYTLTELKGAAFTVDLEISQLLATDAFQTPQVTARVTSFRSQAHGTMRGTTSSLALSGSVTTEVAMEMLRTGATVADRMENHSTVTYTRP